MLFLFLILWNTFAQPKLQTSQQCMLYASVIFVNENENENVEKRENNVFVNENENEKMMKTKLKRKNRK